MPVLYRVLPLVLLLSTFGDGFRLGLPEERTCVWLPRGAKYLCHTPLGRSMAEQSRAGLDDPAVSSSTKGDAAGLSSLGILFLDAEVRSSGCSPHVQLSVSRDT